MSLEYTFKSSCYPIGERKICEINGADKLFTGPAYDKVIEALTDEGIATDSIQSLWYKISKWDKWRKIDSEPLQSSPTRDNNSRIVIKAILKPCIGQAQMTLNKQIEELSNENKMLRQQFDDLVSTVQHIQRQLDNVRINQDRMKLQPTPPIYQQIQNATPVTDSANKDLSVAYLYAIPLVRRVGRWNRSEPIINPIDIHKEINALEKVFVDSHKELQVTVNSGNVTNLRHILGQRPKILHLSCHGGYEHNDGEAKAYLYLEDAKQPGMMEKFDEEMIAKIFSIEKSSDEEMRPRLVFISACHSQRFGEIIKEAGVPNVIAVNSQTQVADEAATGFATTFYYFLLKGKTVKEAFDCAKAEEKYSNMSVNLCCCAHQHKEYCMWEVKKKENSHEAHAMHIPSCDCKFGGNLHKPSCRWLKEIPTDMFEVTTKSSSNLQRVCCCSSDVPHEEEEKFILMSQNMEAASERIFNDVLAGEANITMSFTEELVPKIDEALIGRNLEVQQLVELLSCDPSKKIICVNGPCRVGKRLLIRTAAKYIMECVDAVKYEYENFPDGFVSIKLSNTLWLLSKLNNALLPPPYVEARSLEELPKKILNQRKLVVLECEPVMEANSMELVQKLREILKEGVRIKFVLISRKKIPELDIDGELIIKEDLDMVSAYTIVKSKFPEWKTSYLKFSKTRLAQEMRTPWLVKKAAILLREASEEEVYERLKSERHTNKDVGYENSLNDVLKVVKEKCETLFPVCLLAQMQTGIFESTFKELVDDIKEKLDEYISESGTVSVITKTKVEEVNEIRYTVFDDMTSYINGTKLTQQERASCQLLCLQILSHISRCLIRNCNFLRYKYINYNEITAIIGDGIWAPLEQSFKPLPWSIDPIVRFQCEKDNIIALLDPKILPEMVREVNIDQIANLLDYIKELTICSFTLLHSYRPNEAMNLIDVVQGFASSKNKATYSKTSPVWIKYIELEATMLVIKGSMALNRSCQFEVAEGMKDAEKAEELFSFIKNSAGIGEAQFLQGLLLEQRNRRIDEVEGAYSSAIMSFNNAGCQLGKARVSLAKAVLLLNNMRTDGVLELLNDAIKILRGHEYFSNMVGICHYRRGRYYIMTKSYDLAKQDIESALEDFGQWNNCAVDKCNVSLQEISELKQRDCPMFSYLRAIPLVMKQNDEFIALEPNIRQTPLFRESIKNCLSELNKCVKTFMSTLTLSNLRNVITRGTTVLHISSNHHEDGYLSMEGPLGDLEKISLKELSKEFENIPGIKKLQIVVVSMPKAENVAQMFIELKVPHVIYFDLSNSSFYIYQDQVEVVNIKQIAIQSFTLEFYRNLLKNTAVEESWNKGKEIMRKVIKEECENSKMKFLCSEAEIGPLLFPPGNHNVQIFKNLQNGSFIDTSPKRAQCDIEKDRRSFIGRQLEMHIVAKALYERSCVNLFGKCGVGKTRLAKEVGYFLFVRILFTSYICYFENLDKGKSFKQVLSAKLQCSQSSSSNLPILVIIDNMSRSIWQRERYYFRSLRNDHNCIFLFISQKALETDESDFFPMTNYELKPLEDVELALDMLFELISNTKDLPISSLLHVGNFTTGDLRGMVANLKGFKQSNGFPRLLTIFHKKIIEANYSHSDITEIDMLKDRTIEPRYKRVMKHTSKQRASEILFYSGLSGKLEDDDMKSSYLSNVSELKDLNAGSISDDLKRTKNKFKQNSKSFVTCPFINVLKTETIIEEETPRNDSRESCMGKNMIKLEKSRDISPIADLSEESSENLSEVTENEVAEEYPVSQVIPDNSASNEEEKFTFRTNEGYRNRAATIRKTCAPGKKFRKSSSKNLATLYDTGEARKSLKSKRKKKKAVNTNMRISKIKKSKSKLLTDQKEESNENLDIINSESDSGNYS